MKDWKTPLDLADDAIRTAKAALATADPQGIEEALFNVPTILEDLLDEVRAELCEQNTPSTGS